MSIVSIGPEAGYPTSSDTLEGKRVSRAHKHRYKIIVDSEDDYGDTLLDALPDYTQVGWPFGFGNCLIRSRTLTRDKGNRLLHYLDIDADDKFDDETKNDIAKPPDKRKPDWSWDFETLEYSMRADTDGLDIINSAGDILEVTDDLVIPVLTITRHEAIFDPATILTYVNHVNKTTFWTSDPLTVLCSGIRDRKDTDEVYGGLSYRLVTYVLKFAVPFIADVLEGWQLLLLDSGPNQLVDDGAGGFIKQGIKDPFGVSILGMLNADGSVKAPGAAPRILRFSKKKEAEFNDLKLGPF